MGVSIQEIIREFQLTVCNEGDPDLLVTENELNRCGLQLAGFYGYFGQKRIQILGNAETSYFQSLSPAKKAKAAKTLLSHEIPCVIVTHGNTVPIEIQKASKKYHRWLLATNTSTSLLNVNLTSYLLHELAETMNYHGVLLDVFGVGVLITGKSGIGKSETALALIKNGHLLIADDNVVIKKPSPDTLVGTGSELTKHLLEIRGIGILDIKSLFGLQAIRLQKSIEMVIHLEPWDEETYYDRIGDAYQYREIMGVQIPEIIVPVRTGRNLAVIIEIAALNYRQNVMGYNTAKLLDERIKSLSQGL
ncbi:Hpr(Ser) kinase/phosphatase [Geosporobacter subterraneus DSM 17957]|uniref:HPr kinase/phosphorylase n=1 Tax=Geosporobacter subterraneus DSM 17957 TaxID=1121919 RepID=A0A1M6IQC4_9FIRM|nr:HPr(Ser) kinase/phosphatase [Geosporobacter subterraneus]SHJ36651.1 Hpr(Ser) kinase/phosphatase [Geosporobacter subterraneus DSM 17957]